MFAPGAVLEEKESTTKCEEFSMKTMSVWISTRHGEILWKKNENYEYLKKLDGIWFVSRVFFGNEEVSLFVLVSNLQNRK